MVPLYADHGRARRYRSFAAERGAVALYRRLSLTGNRPEYGGSGRWRLGSQCARRKCGQEIRPVSYTHLDVYKRQLNAYLNRTEIKSFNEDANLKITKEQLDEQIELYEQEQTLSQEQKARTLYTAALEKYSAQLNLQSTSKEKKTTNDTIQRNALSLSLIHI